MSEGIKDKVRFQITFNYYLNALRERKKGHNQ